MAEQQQRRLVGPVHVVEHEDHRVGAARSRRGSRSTASNRRCRSVSGSACTGAASPGTRAGEVGEDARQLAAERAELGAQSVGGHARDVVAQRFRERLERHAELLVAAAPQHDRAVFVRVAHELADEPRLADAGLARHEHGAARAFDAFPSTRSSSVSNGSVRPANGNPGAVSTNAGSGTQRRVDAASCQSTSHTASGSGRPFSSRLPSGSTRTRTASRRARARDR